MSNKNGPSAHRRQGAWIPGEPGLWILVFGDLTVFALFFGTIAYYRLQEPTIFRASQGTLNQTLGLTNTLLLLTSSWLVASAMGAVRRNDDRAASRSSFAAIVLGGGFVGIKLLEYAEKVDAGLTPSTNDFYMLYFVFTGIHLVHVFIGIGALFFLRSRLPLAEGDARTNAIEGCAVFWHLVDLLWVFLFAILYLHQ